MALIYLAHILVPLAAIAWLGLAPARSRNARVGQGIAIGLLLIGFWVAGLWFYPPAWTRWVLAALYIVAVWRAARAPVGKAQPIALVLTATLSVALASFGAVATWQGVDGRQPPAETFDLAPPLAGDRFCVISGGASPLLNLHMATLAPAFAKWRGQSYGADFVAVGASGLRARSLAVQPATLDAYRIYGAEIRAPCAGEVAAARDGLHDQAIGRVDRVNLAGNHVVLRCDGHEVLLGHMQPGSVRVRAGRVVDVGDPLGVVGNSGNSDEPHLHVSVQRPPPQGGPPLSGEPVHVTFGGRFMARGDCLR